MNVKEWIGAILFTIIVMGFLEDAKVTIIILVAFLVILIIIAQIRNMLDKRLFRKFERSKKMYPNAFSFFRKELRVFKSNNNFTKQDINKFLAFSETDWKKREELELKRIQQEKQILSEYNEIKAKYSDGLTYWEKEHPSASRATIVSSIKDIIIFDNRQKFFFNSRRMGTSTSSL